jgi:hypothetical protein
MNDHPRLDDHVVRRCDDRNAVGNRWASIKRTTRPGSGLGAHGRLCVAVRGTRDLDDHIVQVLAHRGFRSCRVPRDDRVDDLLVLSQGDSGPPWLKRQPELVTDKLDIACRTGT